ncbi:MAG: HAD family hydrolase [Magnetococcales bacterium]|nr:HAD family hydrolase [Magnetococcales bacterium]
MKKNLALFDLDETLLEGDSDYLWGRFLVEQGLVDSDAYEQQNRGFYEDYKRGQLDINAYLRFQLHHLTGHKRTTLDDWHDQFMTKMIRPIIRPRGVELVEKHRAMGHTLMIITATNLFVTGPISRALGMDHILATELEEGPDGGYTGLPKGEPCFQAGKIVRLKSWMETHDFTLKGSWFYSDSRNDIPLLEMVDNPVAVDPDDTLKTRAEKEGWPIMSLAMA